MKNAAMMEKQQALDLFEFSSAKDWLEYARREAVALYRKLNRSITIDDLREVCPPPGGAIDDRVMGAVFRNDQWEPDGYTQSERKVCHGRPIRTFRLRE